MMFDWIICLIWGISQLVLQKRDLVCVSISHNRLMLVVNYSISLAQSLRQPWLLGVENKLCVLSNYVKVSLLIVPEVIYSNITDNDLWISLTCWQPCTWNGKRYKKELCDMRNRISGTGFNKRFNKNMMITYLQYSYLK